MASNSVAFLDALRKAGIDGDIDFLREAVGLCKVDPFVKTRS